VQWVVQVAKGRHDIAHIFKNNNDIDQIGNVTADEIMGSLLKSMTFVSDKSLIVRQQLLSSINWVSSLLNFSRSS
jgi:hypothetical protein